MKDNSKHKAEQEQNNRDYKKCLKGRTHIAVDTVECHISQDNMQTMANPVVTVAS